MKEVVQLARDVASALAAEAGAGKKDDLEKQFRDHEQNVLADTREVLHALQK
jgi:hypothetical protein